METMDSSEEANGTLLFFRKDGQAGTVYPLSRGKTTMGSSKDADIRLKLNHKHLELIHCIIEVNNSGIATLQNKSTLAPVMVNTIFVRKDKILCHGDKVELVGKQFQYLNENISGEDIEEYKETLTKAKVIPSKRQSVAPLIKSTKKSPTLRTKTPVQRKVSVRKSFAGSSAEFATSITPLKKSNGQFTLEKPKTTCKVVVSKALGSPRISRRRRLSLGSAPKEFGDNVKVSTRNILLSDNIVTSTITEEDETVPSVSMKNAANMRKSIGEFLDESNTSIENHLETSVSRKRMSIKTPSKSSVKITEREATPKMNTPVNKRLEAFKTPVSLKNSPKVATSARASRSTTRSEGSSMISSVATPIKATPRKSSVDDLDSVFSPRESLKPLSNRSSLRKDMAEKSENKNDVVYLRKSARKSELIQEKEENLLENYSPKNIPPRTTRRSRLELTCLNSDDLSSDEQVSLKLSSVSSISPLRSLSSLEDLSPRSAVSRKSLRKNQSSNAEEEDQIDSDQKSERLSLLEGAGDSPDKTLTRKSLRVEEKSPAISNAELQEYKSPNKSVVKSRLSLRKSQLVAEEKSSEESALQSPPKSDQEPKRSSLKEDGRKSSSKSSPPRGPASNKLYQSMLRKSIRDSQPSLSKEQTLETEYHSEPEQKSKCSSILKEIEQSPNESVTRRSLRRSLSLGEKSPTMDDNLHELKSPNNSSRRSRLSLRKSNLAETEFDETLDSCGESVLDWGLEEEMKPPEGRKSFRSSVRARDNEEEKEELELPNRSATKSRLSLRKTKSAGRESLSLSLGLSQYALFEPKSSKQSLNRSHVGENLAELQPIDIHIEERRSLRKSVTKTEQSFVQTPDKTQTRSSTPKTHSPVKSATKSRLSLKGNDTAETEDFESQPGSNNNSLNASLSESGLANRSVRSSKRSSTRKSDGRGNLAKEDEQYFDGELSFESNLGSPNKSSRSKDSLDKHGDVLSSSDDSLHLRLSDSTKISTRKSESSEVEVSGSDPEEADEELQISQQSLKKSLRNSLDTLDKSFESPIKAGSVERRTSTWKSQEQDLSARKSNRLSEVYRTNVSVNAKSPATRVADQRRSSTRKSVRINEERSINEGSLSDANELYTSEMDETDVQLSREDEGNLGTNADTFIIKSPATQIQRRSSVRRSVRIQEEPSAIEGSQSNTYEPDTSGVYENNVLQLSSEDESVFSETPNDKRISSNRLSVTTRRSMNKSTPISKSNRPSLSISTRNISVITLSDSVDTTPENNTSIVLLDTPFEKEKKTTLKKLSKTLNSTIQDAELTTPKSAIKSRRSMSLPYNPVTEEITPVSPLEKGKNESGFKTPLNTPGLFENIRKSVLKSRSQTQRSSSNFLEELNKVEPKERAAKRRRQSSFGSGRSSKRQKVTDDWRSSLLETDLEEPSESFDSFRTEDVLSDISADVVHQKTPTHFSDLTDKPVINEPRTRSLTEPRRAKSASLRRSLHAMRLETELSSTSAISKGSSTVSATELSSDQSDSVFDNSLDSNISSRRSSRRSSLADQVQKTQKGVQKSPKNDLSDVAGLKKLLSTPKENKSPKNDFIDVRDIKKRMQTPKPANSKNDLPNVPNLRRFMSPKVQNSPKNDLTDVAGVKKLLGTPKVQKSPANDLRRIPNLKKLMSPKEQRSPKNDLSDVAGVKKLLGTPKVQKSPANDLRRIPNLKKLMSPKKQRSPKNDLTNVPNLRRIMSPKQQNSPKNDLSDVRGLKRLLKTPRKTREPKNDLTDVDGVANLFNMSGVQMLNNESDIENNETLFDKLFSKRPLKTYRGKSVSPTMRKAMMFGGQRKTMGDSPLTSPRVKRWVEEQAFISSQKKDDYDTNSEELDEIQSTEDDLEVSRKKRKFEEVPKRRRGERLENVVADETENEEKGTLPKRTLRTQSSKARNKMVKETPEFTGSDEEMTDTKLDDTEFKNENKLTSGKGKTKKDQKAESSGRRQKAAVEVVEESPVSSVVQLKSEYTETDKDVSDTKSDNADLKSKPTRGRGGRQAKKVTEFKAPPGRRGVSRKAAQEQYIEEQVAEVHSTTDEYGSPAPKRETESKEDSAGSDAEIVVLPPRRTRQRGVTRKEKADIIEEPPKPARGRRQKVDEAEETRSPRVVRNRRKVAEKTEDSEENMVTDSENKPVGPKKGRQRNLAHVEKVESTEVLEPNEDHNLNEPKEEKTQSVKLTRSKRRVKDDAQVTPQSPRAVRNRKKVAESIESNEDNKIANTEIVTRVPRKGRQRNLAQEETEDSTKEITPIANSIKRVIKQEETGSPKPAKTRKTVKEDAQETPQSPRPVRSRRKVAEKIEHDNNTTDEIVAKPLRKTRQRHLAQEEVTDSTEEFTPIADSNKSKQDGIQSPKLPKGRRRAKEDAQETPQSPKPVRGRRKVAEVVDANGAPEEDKSPKVARKPTRNRRKPLEADNKVEEDKEVEPPKNARNRRQKKQEQPKEDDPSEEESTPAAAANKGVKGKAIQMEVVDVDSPRTPRAKRGNFRKYGNDFIVDMDVKTSETRPKKVVHFQDSQASVKDGDRGQRRGRNGKAEEFEEEVIRRSKRTRK